MLFWTLAHLSRHPSPMGTGCDHMVIWAAEDVKVATTSWWIVYLHWSMTTYLTHVVFTCLLSLLVLLLRLLITILLMWLLLVGICVFVPVSCVIFWRLFIVLLLLLIASIDCCWGPISCWARLSISWLILLTLFLLLQLCTSSLSSLKVIATIPANTEVTASAFIKIEWVIV